jgi:hypothetical protein
MPIATQPPADPKTEFVNAYANTSLFALSVLRQHGPLADMSLLSVGCHMTHLSDYLALFRTVHHNTMAQTHLPISPEFFPATFVEHRMDFFDLPPLRVDAVISHFAFHCFNDTRYGNTCTTEGWAKPYQVPLKLRQLIGDRRVPIVASVAVNRQHVSYDGNALLGHNELVAAFEAAGFRLAEYFFDYLCGGMSYQPQFMAPEFRRSKELPPVATWPGEWLAGNYFFI